MSKTFNINRFWNYFRWDFNNAKNNFGLSAVIIASMPLIYYLFFELIHRLDTGVWGLQASGNRITWIAVMFLAVMLGLPTKAYGRITEKRAGSDWILRPASAFEKWLSMMAITCIVAPVVIFGTSLLLDTVLSLIFPGTYGDALLGAIGSDIASGDAFGGGAGAFGGAAGDAFGGGAVAFGGAAGGAFGGGAGSAVSGGLGASGDGQLHIMPVWLILANEWVTSVLTFTLGAICFKKSKIGKTILCLIGAGFVMMFAFCTVMGQMSFTDQDLIQRFGLYDLDTITRFLRSTLIVVYSTAFAILSAALYYRIRTIKH